MPRRKKPKVMTLGEVLDVLLTIDIDKKYVLTFTFNSHEKSMTTCIACTSCGCPTMNRFEFGDEPITALRVDQLKGIIIGTSQEFIDHHSGASIDPEDDDNNEIVFHVSNN